MATSQTWQHLLLHILKLPGEQQRMATAMGLSPMTLARWARGESHPQRSHLTHLVQVVQPQYRDELLNALEASYADIQSWLKDETADHISSEFFAELLDLRTTTTE